MDDADDIERAIAADPGLTALREEVRGRLDDDPGHDLSHCMRVALWTVRLGGDAVETRSAVAAALLHDVVNVPKNAPGRADASGRSAEVALELLPRFGFDAEAAREVADAIRDHSFSRGAVPERPLGRALQDADRLEALGAVGLFRTVSTGTRMGARYFDPADPWAERRPRDDLAFTVDHFFEKLLGLAATMCTEAGRREAERRIELMRAFLDELGRELGRPAPSRG